MGEYPALDESEIEAIQAQIKDLLPARFGMSLYYLNLTLDNPVF